MADKEDASPKGAEASDKKVELATLRQVFSFARLRRTKLCIIGGFLCAIVSGAGLPAIAFFFSKAFEDLAASTGPDFLGGVRRVAYGFMALGGIMCVFLTIQNLLMETAAGDMTSELKRQWFAALLRQDMTYYDLQDVSGQATLISANGQKYHKGVGRKLAEIVMFSVSFIGAMGYSFYSSWQVTLALFAIAPFLYLSTMMIIKTVTSQTSRANAAYAKAGSVVSTSVSAIRTVLSLNAVERMIVEYKTATGEACRTAIGNAWILGFANGTQYVSMLMAYILVTLFGSWLLYRGVAGSGCDPSGTVRGVEPCDPRGVGVFGALMGVSFAAAVLPQVSVSLEAFTNARAACLPALVAMSRQIETTSPDEDVEMAHRSSHAVRRELAELPRYEIDSSSLLGMQPHAIKGYIEFRNVNFSFPARPDQQVLRDFSLKIHAGRTVALVGHSGSGKSTIVQLIERFYDPTTGSITLDGVDLRELNVKWLRQQVGLVMQEPKLFAKSIRENISLGEDGISQERIEEAAKMANAHDFIMSFPKGYDTHVGDLGGQLSGGQRQRIAIARVLLRAPNVILLDEATSALDSESEASVQQALDRLLKLKSVTTLVIAHRLSTVRNADLIAVMKAGEIVEAGTHDELVSRRGHYFDLVEAQKTKGDNSTDSESESSGSVIDSRREMYAPHPSDELEKSQIPVFRFRNVDFSYPARPEAPVFQGFNLSVREGETLALVGPSGGGKSTVIQLLESFYRPTQGSIEYYGIDVREINVRWLRDEVGLVSQEATLFAGTIEDNIRFGFPGASMDEIIEAAKEGNCHDFISSFPDGYKTMIGEGGTLVSGGEKQRIAIARALIKKPKVLLLDEATSALDSKSERVVQEALDKIMARQGQTCIVIAHRLSTVRNADRIAVIDNGKVREMGTHDELMMKADGLYKRLQAMQSLGKPVLALESSHVSASPEKKAKETKKELEGDAEDEKPDIAKEELAKNSRRARLLASADVKYIFIGAVGALIAGLFFPAWGVTFAYMIELFYQSVLPCPPTPPGFGTCQDYYDSVAADMKALSLYIFYGYLGLGAAAVVGNILVFWGFGTASERMNKRVRDAAFTNILRQEVAWFDVRAPGTISSHLADDAAMMHAFAGEPVRTLVISLASVFVGIVLSFVFMWPFALLTLGVVPFLTIGAAIEMKTYIGEDVVETVDADEHSPGGIVVETLSNMRTIASLTLEDERHAEYTAALRADDPHPWRSNFVKGCSSGIGNFLQMWGFAIMFWWGGYLLLHYPGIFTYRAYLISMFGLFFSLYGLTLAAQGAVDRDKAKAAAARIFALTDRVSEIDPLSEEGKKDL